MLETGQFLPVLWKEQGPTLHTTAWNESLRKVSLIFIEFYLLFLSNLFSGKGKKIAYKFEGNEIDDCFEITYKELHQQVINCAAVLRSKGVKSGDVVAIYLPMILELPIAMLGLYLLKNSFN